MIRLSPTSLDAYQYWLSTDEPAEKLVESVLRTEPPTEQMRQGLRFHDQLARPGGRLAMRGKDVEFRAPTEWEVPVKRWIASDILLSGRVDGLCGDEIVEIKTTERRIWVEKYQDHWQWRCYLLLLPAMRHVRYEIFRIRAEGATFRLLDHATITCPRYRRLEADVMEVAAKYVWQLTQLAHQGWIRLGADGRPKYGPRAIDRYGAPA